MERYNEKNFQKILESLGLKHKIKGTRNFIVNFARGIKEEADFCCLFVVEDDKITAESFSPYCRTGLSREIAQATADEWNSKVASPKLVVDKFCNFKPTVVLHRSEGTSDECVVNFIVKAVEAMNNFDVRLKKFEYLFR